MRVKQTARKSTSRSEADPMLSRARVLETKRTSLGRAASSFIKLPNSSSNSRSSLPATRSSQVIGNNGRGKQLPYQNDVKVKEKPRGRMGANVLREIKKYRSSTEMLIPRAPFHRVVREITQSLVAEGELRYQMAAIMALQEAAEAYMVRLFEDAYMLTHHAKRVTLFSKDIELCRRLRRE